MAGGVTILDIAAALIVIVSVATAAHKGLAAELIFLASVVAGLVLAFAFYDRLAALLSDLGTSESSLALLGGFLLIFAAVVAGGPADDETGPEHLEASPLEMDGSVAGGGIRSAARLAGRGHHFPGHDGVSGDGQPGG